MGNVRFNFLHIPGLFVAGCLLTCVYSPRARAEQTTTAAAIFATEQLLRDGDTRDQARVLDLISLSPASRNAFVEVLKQRATPEQLQQLSEKMEKLRADFRENPVSYGVSGGLRIPIALMFLLNVHITIQGFNGAFIQPDDKEWFAEVSMKANQLGGLLVAYAAGKDLMIFKREYGMSADHKAAMRGLNQTLDQLQTAITEAKSAPSPTAPTNPDLFPEIRSLVTTLDNGLKVHPSLPQFDGTSKENRDALRGYLEGLAGRYRELGGFQKQVRNAMQGLSPSEAGELALRIHEANLDPSFRLSLNPETIFLEQEFRTEFAIWLAAHPGELPNLLKQTFEREEASLSKVVATHRISRPAQWTLAASTIYTFVWGAMTNMGKEPNLVDLTPAGVNLNQLVRDFWINHGNTLGAYAFAGTGLAYVLTLAYRNIGHETNRAKAKQLSLNQWNFIRGAALAAQADLDAGRKPEVSAHLSGLTATELLDSHESRTRRAKIDPVAQPKFTAPAYTVCRDTLKNLAHRAWDRLVWEFR